MTTKCMTTMAYRWTTTTTTTTTTTFRRNYHHQTHDDIIRASRHPSLFLFLGHEWRNHHGALCHLRDTAASVNMIRDPPWRGDHHRAKYRRFTRPMSKSVSFSSSSDHNHNNHHPDDNNGHDESSWDIPSSCHEHAMNTATTTTTTQPQSPDQPTITNTATITLSSSTNTTTISSTKPTTDAKMKKHPNQRQQQKTLILEAEGLFAIQKPLDWTSSNVVSYIRRMVERDVKHRQGIIPGKVGTKSKNVVRVGHGGTLDPLATGVLVIGIGNGTKQLSNYLSGNKVYKAIGELGYETTTLDREGNITKTSSYDHITSDMIQDTISQYFLGPILQIPPFYSAIKKDGKALYKVARQQEKQQQRKQNHNNHNNHSTTNDTNHIHEMIIPDIEAREVMIYNIICSDINLPYFTIQVECGGGTYIRSLIRDIAYRLNTVATTIQLERIQQGPFHINDAIPHEQWTDQVGYIYDAIRQFHQTNHNTSSQ